MENCRLAGEGTLLFTPISEEVITKITGDSLCLESGFWLNGNRSQEVQLVLTNHYLAICEKGFFSNIFHYYTPLLFDLKFEPLYAPLPDNSIASKKIGFRLHRAACAPVDFQIVADNVIDIWMKCLTRSLNQLGFHKLYKPIKKIGKGGFATVYEQPYEMWDMWGPYTEIITNGAFADTLARADLDVPLVLQHEQLRRIARTTNGSLTLTEDDHGLRVLATLDPADTDVAYIAPKLRSGLIDEMSFAFRIDAGQWSPDYTEYRINKVNLHRGDTAIVGFGANPATAGSGLREEADLHKMLRAASDDEARAILTELRERFPARQPYVEEALLPLV